MKSLASILCLFLVSCADRVPRAIIPPPSVVEALDVAPVAAAGKAAGESVREVADAGQKSREASRKVSDATRRLTDSIVRIETLSFANAELTRSVAESLAFAKELEANVVSLTASLAFAEEKERIAIETIGALNDETALLKANAQAQAVQIRQAEATEKTLREHVAALADSADKRVIAEEKLGWWRKAAGLTWAMIAVFSIIKIFGAAIATNFRI